MKTRFVVALAAGALIAAGQTGKALPEGNCSSAQLGTDIPAASIGEPVSAVKLTAFVWITATSTLPAHCKVDGAMLPVETGTSAKPILFRILLPGSWSGHAAQIGGGGMNGVIPDLTGTRGITTGAPLLARGFAVYGSDSGHANGTADWALSDEAIRNLGYMQMKKTHDAAMVLTQRAYGDRPQFNYYFGTSQGGREALTVAQRYSADYDGIIANVPIVNFSSLMLAPELIRIHEKPIANWLTPAKINAVRGEFMRQCDSLDGLVDGLINNYMACRAIFDVKQGRAGRDPWAAKRCPGDRDPNPADTSAIACLTSGQIATLDMVYSPYMFATPLAHGVRSFGMWVPNTDPSGSGLIAPTRFRGQEGAPQNAAVHSHLGALGVTGFLMQDPAANPLDYVEGGKWNGRRKQLSEWLDATDPDLSRFAARGGKVIVTIGTNDTLASPGAQLAYYESLIAQMGQGKVDTFARLFVLPQTNHGLMGTNYVVNGRGERIETAAIPNTYDRLGLLTDWVEKKVGPGRQIPVAAGARTLPMCSYPEYPKYLKGPATEAASYTCAAK
ncbi:MAG: Tannase and feruloyl esterase [Bryobacterales bacterium]|nr:Tannase and feruloyl esterase [Bryobacterales bacterium]